MNNICPGCGAGYNVTPQHVGRQLACKKCGAMLVVKTDGLHLATAEPVGQAAEPDDSDQADDYGAERAFARRATRGNGASAFGDFLAFRRMIVPIIIQILFWLGVLACFVAGILGIAAGNAAQIAISLLVLFLGPLLVRIYCELLIVVFRINETLTDVRNLLKDWKK